MAFVKLVCFMKCTFVPSIIILILKILACAIMSCFHKSGHIFEINPEVLNPVINHELVCSC